MMILFAAMNIGNDFDILFPIPFCTTVALIFSDNGEWRNALVPSDPMPKLPFS